MKIGFIFLTILLFTSCSEDSKAKVHDVYWDQVMTDKEAVSTQIEIFSEQFKWTVRYSGKDNTLGKFDYKLINKINPLGIMTSDAIEWSILNGEVGPMGIQSLGDSLIEGSDNNQIIRQNDEFREELRRKKKIDLLLNQMKKKHDVRIDAASLDDIILTDTLVLCVDEAFEIQFRSKDVIHSAYFPDFRAQFNTIPGVTPRFNYTPRITTKQMRIDRKDAEFEFMLQCNKICGAGHDKMKMVVRVLEKEEFIDWQKRVRSYSFRKTNDTMKLFTEQRKNQ